MDLLASQKCLQIKFYPGSFLTIWYFLFVSYFFRLTWDIFTSVIEVANLMEVLLSNFIRFPLYYHMKFAFLVWLQLPSVDVSFVEKKNPSFSCYIIIHSSSLKIKYNGLQALHTVGFLKVCLTLYMKIIGYIRTVLDGKKFHWKQKPSVYWVTWKSEN